MRSDLIIDEFLDYRAYVSHTLCAHRLFLGVSSAEDARARFGDAGTWPFVMREIVQLFADAREVMGITNSELYRTYEPRIRELLEDIDELQVALRGGDDHIFMDLYELVRQLKDAVSAVNL